MKNMQKLQKTLHRLGIFTKLHKLKMELFAFSVFRPVKHLKMIVGTSFLKDIQTICQKMTVNNHKPFANYGHHPLEEIKIRF